MNPRRALTRSLAIAIAALVVWGLVAPENLGAVMSAVLAWVIGNFGWVFVLIAFGALVLCIFLVLHPWGRIRLGPDDARPEFRTFSWVSMMFAAGLGAGLLFYGTAEPISHWSAPPHGLAEPQTEEAAKIAKTAHRNGTTLRKEAVSGGYVTDAEFDEIVRPEKMIAPG